MYGIYFGIWYLMVLLFGIYCKKLVSWCFIYYLVFEFFFAIFVFFFFCHMVLIGHFGSFIICKCFISWNDVNGIKIILFNYTTKLQLHLVLQLLILGIGMHFLVLGVGIVE